MLPNAALMGSCRSARLRQAPDDRCTPFQRCSGRLTQPAPCDLGNYGGMPHSVRIWAKVLRSWPGPTCPCGGSILASEGGSILTSGEAGLFLRRLTKPRTLTFAGSSPPMGRRTLTRSAGRSWLRLDGSLVPGSTSLVVDGRVGQRRPACKARAGRWRCTMTPVRGSGNLWLYCAGGSRPAPDPAVPSR
jgi:hypothetical protein